MDLRPLSQVDLSMTTVSQLGLLILKGHLQGLRNLLMCRAWHVPRVSPQAPST